MDIVELCNLGNQMYTEKEIGIRKVDAAKKIIQEKGYKGNIFTYFTDINTPAEDISFTQKCSVYISCVDTYQSRVNFFYHVVMESKNPERIYIDCGAERFRGHCFFTLKKTSPCIYCVRWLFQDERKVQSLCSLRSTLPEKDMLTPERRKSVIATLHEREIKKADKKNLSNLPNLPKSPEKNVYKEVAKEFNRIYDVEKKATEEEVKESISSILPNIVPVSQIIGSIVYLVLSKKPEQKNFILYIGDSCPTFHLHLLLPDPVCFLCGQ